MVMSLVPATPVSQTPQSAVATPPTGTWQHPKFDEIARRQGKARFTDKNLRRIVWNGVSLLGTWLLVWIIRQSPMLSAAASFKTHLPYYMLLLLRLLFTYNILAALYPLLVKDELVDIPLTPSQRALLGLDPNVPLPATPASEYSTPPRYPRSSTPRSPASEARSSSYSASPLSGKGSPLPGKGPAASHFSPNMSPLFQKAINWGIKDGARRYSQGSLPQLGQSLKGMDSSIISLPSTPTPPVGKGASVGLNNRWLYERGREGTRM